MVRHIRAWWPAAVWMGVIYLMSAMPGDLSGETSGRLLQLVLRVLALVGLDGAVDTHTLHILIRKAAHMTEYAVLFYLYRRALSMEGAKRPGLYALLLCAAYAATDEWHQAYVGGRGPSAVDVCIDTLGAAAMWGMMQMARMTKKRNESA